jgi:hypothetical protein
MTDVEIPSTMRKLLRDKHRRPVPWFVAWVNGEPDFRIIGPGRIQDALRLGLCWVCGDALGAHKAFLIGPMCVVNRITAEPPSHLACADYSAKACPFLTTPNMVRRDKHKPAGTTNPPGTMIMRNPGASAVWVTKRFQLTHVGDGYLFRLGDPTEVRWYAQGRTATRAEVDASIDSGLPILRQAAEEDGPRAVKELERMHADALGLLP